MKKIIFIILYAFASLIMAKPLEFNYTFTDSTENVELIQYGNSFGPQINYESLILVQGYRGNNHNNVARFGDSTNKLYKNIQLSFKMNIGTGAEGCGFALLNTDYFTKRDSLNFSKWEEPSIKESFAIGFDISNPPTSAIFDEYGNYYNNPEREISLHWNGMEIKKILSPIEFRADANKDDEFKNFMLQIDYVIGGAEISLSIDDIFVFEKFFIAEMQPYPSRLAIGARTGLRTTNVYIDDVKLKFSNKIKDNILPINVKLIDEQAVFMTTRETSHQVIFPKFPRPIERAILTLKIADLPGGYDPWDEGGHIYIWQDSIRYEICRFITPYHRGHTWKVDVTDFIPLFKNEKKVDLFVGTWMKVYDNPEEQKGWKISVDIDFYEGKPQYSAYKIQNIWNGEFEYGNPKDPLQNHLPQIEVDVPKEAKSAKLKIMVTGHGMSPNTGIAAEFMPANRSVYINKKKHENLLWKTDCYLNSCRPQGGTWKFNRAGWAPGSVVESWDIEITNEMLKEGKLKLNYIPESYRNLDESDCYKPHHAFESQLIFYK